MEQKNLFRSLKLLIIGLLAIPSMFGQSVIPFSSLPIQTATDTSRDKVVMLHWNGTKYENAIASPGTMIKKAIISGAITGTGTNHYLAVWISANKQAIGYLYQGLNKIVLPSGIAITSGDSVARMVALTGSHPGWGLYSHGDKSHPFAELKSGSGAIFGYDSVNAETVTSSAFQIQHQAQISLTSPYVFIAAADTFQNKGYTKATRGGADGLSMYDSLGWNTYKPYPAVGILGTAGYIPRFYKSKLIGNSILYQDTVNGRIGLNTAAPSAVFDLQDLLSTTTPIGFNLNKTCNVTAYNLEGLHVELTTPNGYLPSVAHLKFNGFASLGASALYTESTTIGIRNEVNPGTFGVISSYFPNGITSSTGDGINYSLAICANKNTPGAFLMAVSSANSSLHSNDAGMFTTRRSANDGVNIVRLPNGYELYDHEMQGHTNATAYHGLLDVNGYWTTAGFYRCIVDGTASFNSSGSDSLPGAQIWGTNPGTGGAQPIERFRIDHLGRLLYPSDQSANYLSHSLADSGFVKKCVNTLLASGGYGTGTVTSVSGTTNRITSTGGTTPVIDISSSYVGQSTITTLGTIGTGTWHGSVIEGTYGGTGVNNGSSTITIGGNLTFSGAYTFTGTLTGTTAVTFPTSGTLATLSGTETLTNKRITPRLDSITSSSTPTPNASNDDEFIVTALAAAATITNPTGVSYGGQKLIIRIKDNGTARALTFDTQYRFSSNLAAPTTTTISKTMYLGFIRNETDGKWDCMALLDGF